MTVHLSYIVSHPIQYQAPLLRLISAQDDIDLKVYFEDDFSSRPYFDPGFSTEVRWDVPLTDGYDHAMLRETEVRQILDSSDALWFHGWQSPESRRLLKQAFAAGKPTLMRGENWAGAMPDGWGPAGWVKRRYLTSIFDHCSAFLAIGEANERYYRAHGIAAEKIFSMPYAVDNDFFSRGNTPDGRAAFRAELGLPEGQSIILFAGKLTERKQPQVLLTAWTEAFSHHPNPPPLVFAGDGELRGALAKSASNHVYFTGFKNQSELPSIYGAADVFVLASKKEPWGLSINESMACGTAVVASTECGASFDLVDDSCGRSVSPGDSGELGRALQSVLPRSTEMGETALRKIAGWNFEADLTGLRTALEAVV